MRISDWSSDVCSSDLHHLGGVPFGRTNVAGDLASLAVEQQRRRQAHGIQLLRGFAAFVDVASEAFDTYLGVEGVDDSHAGRSEERRVGKERVSSVDLGGRRIIKKKNTVNNTLCSIIGNHIQTRT